MSDNAVEQLGLFLRGIQFGGGFLGQRSANALERFHVAGAGFDGQLARQQEIAGVAGLDGDDVAAVTELFDVFLKNNLHDCVLLSSYFPNCRRH